MLVNGSTDSEGWRYGTRAEKLAADRLAGRASARRRDFARRRCFVPPDHGVGEDSDALHLVEVRASSPYKSSPSAFSPTGSWKASTDVGEIVHVIEPRTDHCERESLLKSRLQLTTRLRAWPGRTLRWRR